VTLSSGEGASSDVSPHSGREGIKGGKKRCKQRLQGAVTMTSHNDGQDRDVGGSDMRCTLIATCHDNRQARPPTDHFKRLREEACPNHAYPVRHELKECSMIRSFMSLGSLT
jgi:hypothetical protein